MRYWNNCFGTYSWKGPGVIYKYVGGFVDGQYDGLGTLYKDDVIEQQGLWRKDVFITSQYVSPILPTNPILNNSIDGERKKLEEEKRQLAEERGKLEEEKRKSDTPIKDNDIDYERKKLEEERRQLAEERRKLEEEKRKFNTKPPVNNAQDIKRQRCINLGLAPNSVDFQQCMK